MSCDHQWEVAADMVQVRSSYRLLCEKCGARGYILSRKDFDKGNRRDVHLYEPSSVAAYMRKDFDRCVFVCKDPACEKCRERRARLQAPDKSLTVVKLDLKAEQEKSRHQRAFVDAPSMDSAAFIRARTRRSEK